MFEPPKGTVVYFLNLEGALAHISPTQEGILLCFTFQEGTKMHISATQEDTIMFKRGKGAVKCGFATRGPF